MNADPIPLHDALKAFIRFDNKFFSQELAQNEHEQHEDSRKRGPISLYSPDSKRRNRSNSVDSMATNHASAGDFDEEMRDAEFVKFDDETVYENSVEKATTNSNHGMVEDGLHSPLRREDARDPHANELVDLLTPPNEEVVESKTNGSSNTDGSMDTTSERIGRVSLDEDSKMEDTDFGQTEVATSAVSSQASGSSVRTEDSDITVKPIKPIDDGTATARSPEMQERSNIPLLASKTADSTPQPSSRATLDF